MVSGTSPPVSMQDISTNTTKYTATIVAGTNSITVTHNLSRLAKFNSPYMTNDEASVVKIINEGINSFDIALPAGMLAGNDITIAGTFV